MHASRRAGHGRPCLRNVWSNAHNFKGELAIKGAVEMLHEWHQGWVGHQADTAGSETGCERGCEARVGPSFLTSDGRHVLKRNAEVRNRGRTEAKARG
jgi:hypothetical protein